MSVQRQSVPSNEVDLESTAELPVLDVADVAAATPTLGSSRRALPLLPQRRLNR
jgi:hypothetical protein